MNTQTTMNTDLHPAAAALMTEFERLRKGAPKHYVSLDLTISALPGHKASVTYNAGIPDTSGTGYGKDSAADAVDAALASQKTTANMLRSEAAKLIAKAEQLEK